MKRSNSLGSAESIQWESLVINLGDLALSADVAQQWTEAASGTIDAIDAIDDETALSVLRACR